MPGPGRTPRCPRDKRGPPAPPTCPKDPKSSAPPTSCTTRWRAGRSGRSARGPRRPGRGWRRTPTRSPASASRRSGRTASTWSGRSRAACFFHSHYLMWGRWMVVAPDAPEVETRDRRERARIVTDDAAALLYSAPKFTVGRGRPLRAHPRSPAPRSRRAAGVRPVRRRRVPATPGPGPRPRDRLGVGWTKRWRPASATTSAPRSCTSAGWTPGGWWASWTAPSAGAWPRPRLGSASRPTARAARTRPARRPGETRG